MRYADGWRWRDLVHRAYLCCVWVKYIDLAPRQPLQMNGVGFVVGQVIEFN